MNCSVAPPEHEPYGIKYVMQLGIKSSEELLACNGLNYFDWCEDQALIQSQLDDCFQNTLFSKENRSGMSRYLCVQRVMESCGQYKKFGVTTEEAKDQILVSNNHFYGALLFENSSKLNLLTYDCRSCQVTKPEDRLLADMNEPILRVEQVVDLGNIGRNAKWIATLLRQLVVGEKNTTDVWVFDSTEFTEVGENALVEPRYYMKYSTDAFKRYYGTSAGQAFPNPVRNSLFTVTDDKEINEMNPNTGHRIGTLKPGEFATAMKPFLNGSALRDKEVCGFDFITENWLIFNDRKQLYLMRLDYDPARQK